MKSKLLSAFLLSSSFAFADAEKPINETLRDALYAEEVTRDIEAAAKRYEEVVSRYQTQRDFAATALFRLAEVRRKQDRKEDAIKLYQQLITEFPSSEKQVTLAKENLTALGGILPGSIKEPEMDREAETIARIQKMEITSPDRAYDDQVFQNAISDGFPRVITYLLEKGADPDRRIEENHTLLSLAARSGNLAICELLLEAGANPNPPSTFQPLMCAIEENHIIVADLLIKKGADVNYRPAGSDGFPGGRTPLLYAIEKQSPKMVEKLIAGGADVNLTSRSANMSPLHRAIFAKDIEVIRKLVSAGANPDIATSATGVTDGLQIKEGGTALMRSIASPEIFRLLLPKSKKADLSILLGQAVEWGVVDSASIILDAAKDKAALINQTQPPPLIGAVGSGVLEMVRLLLKAGADPNVSVPLGAYSNTPLTAAVRLGDRGFLIAEALIASGAKATPDDGWSWATFTGKIEHKDDASGDRSKINSLIVETFIIPELTRQTSLTLLFKIGAKFGTRELSPVPAPLAELLLKHDETDSWPTFQGNGFPYQITVWRKADGGTAAVAWTGSLLQKEDFPLLLAGDVIQLGDDKNKRSSPQSWQDDLPKDIRWNLKRRISFPIQVEINGKVTDFTVRGDRLVFDPTKPELPWVSSGMLAELLWPCEFSKTDFNVSSRVKSSVSRDGWPDMQIEKLKAGDRLKIIRPENDPQELEYRRHRISITPAGMHGGRQWSVVPNLDENDKVTLVQVLADTLSFSPLYGTKDPDENGGLVPWYDGWNQLGAIGRLWNDPDFSSIVIHRLDKDGVEKRIEVDLAKRIKTADLEGSAEEIKNKDVTLQGGDVIEIKLRGDTKDSVWRGLSDREASFFAKALSGSIQFRQANSDVASKELIFSPLQFIDTEAGKLPARRPGTEGYPSMTLRAIFGNSGNIIRNGKTYDEMPTRPIQIPFLKNGDQVLLGTRPAGPMQMPVPQSQPRPRVLSPAR